MARTKTIVTDAPINLNGVMKWAPDSKHGAGNIFVGFVRDLNMGRSVVAVEYDCFKALAEKVFAQIADEAREKWGSDATVFIIHRHGLLKVGEPSIAIYVTTKHRDESYLASRYIIEEIKTRAPIWKKEFYVDGETEWVRGHALCGHGHRAPTPIAHQESSHGTCL
jgi:molybdopterin synthase catalytic subunit